MLVLTAALQFLHSIDQKGYTPAQVIVKNTQGLGPLKRVTTHFYLVHNTYSYQKGAPQYQKVIYRNGPGITHP